MTGFSVNPIYFDSMVQRIRFRIGNLMQVVMSQNNKERGKFLGSGLGKLKHKNLTRANSLSNLKSNAQFESQDLKCPLTKDT